MAADRWTEMIAKQNRRIAELERRLKNVVRYGTIEDVDYAKGLVRVKDGELKSGWMPWHDTGGAIKTWTPPSKGQVAIMFNPSGDIGQGIAFAGQFSNQNKQPHDKGSEYKMTNGGSTILVTGDKVHITAGKIILEGTVYLGGEGGELVHRKGDLDSDGDAAVESATKVYAL